VNRRTDDHDPTVDTDPDGGPSGAGEGSASSAADRSNRQVTTNGAGTVDRPAPRRVEEESGDDDTLETFVFDIVSSALAVLLVGALLFAVSGVWPPMVAVESPSMTPHMQTGDLVFVMEETRFPGDGAVAGTGIVTAQAGETTDYRKFEQTGDVIVYEPDGRSDRTPIIHRAMFYVEEGENWYDRADRQSLGNAEDCDSLSNCPAPHAGFITKGDANGVYDQVQGLSGPVKSAWVVGTAQVRVPKLGCIRLRSEGCVGPVRASTGNATAIGT
jgi:signal peptidase